MAVRPSRSFKDLSLTFNKNPLKKDLVILKDENAVKRALLNLFSYKKGEKFFQPSFGSGIPELLFETFDYVTAGAMRDQIIDLVQRYEPRIKLLEVIINLNDEENTYDVQIDYIMQDLSNQIRTVNLSLSPTTKVL